MSATLRFTSTQTQHLARAVANCLLFVERGRTALPILQSVRFEFDGRTLTLVSTDRYRLCFETVEWDEIHHGGNQWAVSAVEPHPSFDFLLDTADAKSLLTLLKAVPKYAGVDITLDGDKVTATVPGGLSAWRTQDFQFPKWRQLLPDTDSAVPVDHIRFNPKQLADLCKVQSGWPNNPVTLVTFGANKPVLCQYQDGPTVLTMPVKRQS